MPTEHRRLTKAVVDAAEYRGTNNARFVIYDEHKDSPPGFGLRVYPSGKKVFILRYRNQHGRSRLTTVAEYGPKTLQEAREDANALRAAVKDGQDPIAEDTARRQGATVEDLAREYVEKHAKVHKKTWETDRDRLVRHLGCDLEGYNHDGAHHDQPTTDWSQLKAADVKHSDVAELHRTLGKERGKYEANRTLALISVMFNFARDEGIIPREMLNPAESVKKYREKKRERWVTPEEMAALGPAIDADENPYLRAAFWLLLLTGARKSEILKLTWDNVDLERLEIHFPDTKADRPHTVPLSSYAADLVKGLTRQDGNPFVICGTKEGQAFVNVRKPWLRTLERANAELDEQHEKKTGEEPATPSTQFDDLQIHDLRRTAASWLAQSGYSEFVIKQLLNHSVRDVTGIYARMRPGAIRNAVEELGRQLYAAAGKIEGGDVVELSAWQGRS